MQNTLEKFIPLRENTRLIQRAQSRATGAEIHGVCGLMQTYINYIYLHNRSEDEEERKGFLKNADSAQVRLAVFAATGKISR